MVFTALKVLLDQRAPEATMALRAKREHLAYKGLWVHGVTMDHKGGLESQAQPVNLDVLGLGT